MAKIGDTFEVEMPLSIGKDGRNVRRIVVALIQSETPKMYRVRYDWQGLTTEGAEVRVTGHTRLPKDAVDTILAATVERK